jgi:hypothetical protein
MLGLTIVGAPKKKQETPFLPVAVQIYFSAGSLICIKMLNI